ncbi:MAG: hypothetical protein ACRDHU_10820 [Actinomycetota bacterium]
MGPDGARARHHDLSVFTGEINWVEIDVGEAAENVDHLIDAEERLRIAMARQ